MRILDLDYNVRQDEKLSYDELIVIITTRIPRTFLAWRITLRFSKPYNRLSRVITQGRSLITTSQP